jgi:two-component system sensor histidine kinase HydH
MKVVGPVQVFSTDNFAGLDAALDNLARRLAQVIERLQSAERERLRNDQMAALGQLAAGLAHELRNPLTAMKTIVDAARREGRGHLHRRARPGRAG